MFFVKKRRLDQQKRIVNRVPFSMSNISHPSIKSSLSASRLLKLIPIVGLLPPSPQQGGDFPLKDEEWLIIRRTAHFHSLALFLSSSSTASIPVNWIGILFAYDRI